MLMLMPVFGVWYNSYPTAFNISVSLPWSDFFPHDLLKLFSSTRIEFYFLQPEWDAMNYKMLSIWLIKCETWDEDKGVTFDFQPHKARHSAEGILSFAHVISAVFREGIRDTKGTQHSVPRVTEGRGVRYLQAVEPYLNFWFWEWSKIYMYLKTYYRFNYSALIWNNSILIVWACYK